MNHFARVCKQILKPHGDCNVNKIRDSIDGEEYSKLPSGHGHAHSVDVQVTISDDV